VLAHGGSGAGLWSNRPVVENGPGARRRETGAASARSLLLTVLGEFVLPHDHTGWTGALVSALAEVGVEEKAARQALTRTAAEDLLRAEREGRRTRWHLTPRGVQLLTEGAERIYGFGREVEDWDGRWLVVVVSVPETQRQLRHSLRTRLTWAGLGSPTPGLWVTPDASKEKAVGAVIAALGVEALSFVGPFGQIGEEHRVVSQAWALDDVEQRYRDFLKAFASSRTGSPADAFRSQVQLVQQWRRFPFLDPGLPAELLHPGWPGNKAADLFHSRHDRWHSAAQAYWESLMTSAAQKQ
jgi:phenylacetic acid degradation operon negative regulatory protein